MFMRFQRALLTLAREWRDLDLERLAAEKSPDAHPSASHDASHTETAAGPASATATTAPEESAA